MARKRMIDPEFWLDEDITSLDFEYRLFYIGTWNFADDYGVLENSPKKLKAQVFPYDDVDCEKMLKKLIDLKRLIPFEKQGKNWLYIGKFLKYQRVDKPSKNRNPEAPKDIVGEDSLSTQELLGDEVKRSKENISKENIELPIWLNKKAWEAWVQDRKDRNKKLTSKAIELQLKKLESFGIENHTQVIKNAIENGWQTFYPLKDKNHRVVAIHKRDLENEDDRERKISSEDNTARNNLLKQSKDLVNKFTER